MTARTQTHRLRNIVGGSAGNLVEWYDWYTYSAFTLYFAPIFFPAGDRTLQLLKTAAVPGHAAIGVLAPAVLVLARMLQGLSVGGEYGASATYLSEMAGRERRAFWASFQYITLIGGQLL